MVRFGIKNLQARRFLLRSLRWEFTAEDQNRGAILQTRKDKQIETSQYDNVIPKDSLSRSIFVLLLSNITPRILKESHEFRKVMPTKKIKVMRKYSPRPTNNHTLSFCGV